MLDAQDARPTAQFAGKVIAKLFRCPDCGAWWGSSKHSTPETHLVFKLVEPNSERFLWHDYRGWYRQSKAKCCPACGQEMAVAEVTLRYDDEGQVQWPENEDIRNEKPAETTGNPFADYISQSKRIEENITFLIAREAQQVGNEWGYKADLDDIREDINAMRSAFKNVVYRYASILPPGWRVTGDYDKWLKGQACAGFLHGDMHPDNSLLIGGLCHTVAEIEMELDRLHSYVFDLSF
jgi:hypothetical protein